MQLIDGELTQMAGAQGGARTGGAQQGDATHSRAWGELVTLLGAAAAWFNYCHFGFWKNECGPHTLAGRGREHAFAERCGCQRGALLPRRPEPTRGVVGLLPLCRVICYAALI